MTPTQHDNAANITLDLHRRIDACLRNGDVPGALRACSSDMSQLAPHRHRDSSFASAVDKLIELVLAQFGKATYPSVAAIGLEALATHAIHSKDVVRALGLHYEKAIQLTDAYAAYLSNVEELPDDAQCWQDLLRVATALAVGTSHETLDSLLTRLRQQGTQFYVATIVAALDEMETARPDDLYLLACCAHEALPTDPCIWWYWLNAMTFTERNTPEEASQHTVRWALHLASTQATPSMPLSRHNRDGRIRVGYIASGLHFMFLRNHLPHHDFSRFDIHLITDDPRCTPQRFGPHVSIAPLGPGDPTERLRQQGFDLAIDMMGPSYRSRWRGIEGFLAFTKRIAPVQCHWISTTSTSGSIAGFDYLLADEGLVPPALEHLYVERTERLGEVAHCWSPSQGGEASTPPFTTNGFITFGSANRGTKVTNQQLMRWASVVTAVPDSRMVIKGTHVMDPLFVARARHVFRQHGVEQRLALEDATAHPVFPSSFYSKIDISLDTYPYTGGITTIESLWNGVPVITRSGDSFVSRLAGDYLGVIGCGHWVADSDSQLVDIAVRLAADHDDLSEARRTLRGRLASSPIVDGPRFARSLEASFLNMLEGR